MPGVWEVVKQELGQGVQAEPLSEGGSPPAAAGPPGRGLACRPPLPSSLCAGIAPSGEK